MAIERQRVSAGALLAVIVALAAAGAALADASPTGSPGVDVVLVAVVAGAVTLAAASAPWWASAGAAGIGATVALEPVVWVLGTLGFVGGLAVGVRGDRPELRAVVGGIAVNALIRSELGGFFGLSSLIGIATCSALFLVGVWNRPHDVRRVAILGLGAVAGLAIVAIAAGGLSAMAARSDVATAASRSEEAIDALNDGDYVAAADLFDEAADSYAGVHDALGGTLAAPAAVIPGISQNLRAGRDLAETASSATAEAADALRQADLSNVRFVDGRIDLDTVRGLEEPVLRLQVVLEELSQVVTEVDSPWLVGPLRAQLAELDADLADNEARLADVIEAVRVAPAMLGGDGPRRYLILFTTPAEARGLGGFVGNFAEVRAFDGRIVVSEFAGRSELEDHLAQTAAFCIECPAELLDRYGRFGFDSGPDGAVEPRVWSNITMPAHFPYVAEAAAILYPQSGGAPIDGVIVMDPYVIEALMGFTGPIEIPELDRVVRPDEAAEFILGDQYLELDDGGGSDDRIDALQSLGEGVVTALLTSSLPDPPDLARELAPMVEERRLLMWAVDDREREFLDRVGALGALPELGPDGGFSVSVTNGGASKIDVFLDRAVDVAVGVADDGTRRLTARVVLTNNAPSSGLPDDVIGNAVGLPTGTSRLFVTFYGPRLLEAAFLDRSPLPLERSAEAGWSAYGDNVDLGPGQSVEYVLEFRLEPAPGVPGPPVEFVQPLADR